VHGRQDQRRLGAALQPGGRFYHAPGGVELDQGPRALPDIGHIGQEGIEFAGVDSMHREYPIA
jgi:hypothetical protein